MKNLVINAGSSSVKFQVFENEESVLSGLCEEIGTDRARLKIEFNGGKEKLEMPMKDHKEAFAAVLDALKSRGLFDDIDFVSHRVVHGGEKFCKTTLIDDDAVEELKKIIPLAPLHNPANIEGIEIMREFLPESKHFGVFDTAFHSTIAETGYLYAVPYEWYTKHGVRKYGFHGSSHKYVINEAMKKLNKPDAKIISCHLGNGASVCAAIGGKSMNTSMGLTPLEGLMMGTRCGSIDPAIIKFMHDQEGMSIADIDDALNKKSGILGVSQFTSDMREIRDGIAEGNVAASRAFNLFCQKVLQTVGSYAAEMNGVDAIVFTGGIGEKGNFVREYICNHFGFLGGVLDEEKNTACFACYAEISKPESKIRMFVIPTNEELQMTLDCEELMK